MVSMRTLSADRIGGLIWIVFGAAVIYGSWTMDRLQSLGIPPSTAPGVVPGLLGIGIILFGLVLVLRGDVALKPALAEAEGAAPAEPTPSGSDFHWKRAALSAFLCLTYGGALLGSGVPYWLLTMAFLFLHIILLDETADVPARPNLRRLITAAIIAPTFAIAVSLVFQYIFLVRLP
jgi:putative tricarboxylic transport membrane protein